ncbi:class II aldolase/adducin family protein [Citreimonas sp.]|uniref:class II aldolase/adducin family protein n=1 Tax=Citreimonas sp. TaxID=3036715 RepID=UPI0035C85D63
MSAHPTSGGAVEAGVLADLAAASRILAARGVVDGFGHVSMRHPHAPDRYLMARAIAPALVTPDDIVEYDLDSTPCAADAPKGFLERFIHGEILRARPDIHSVVHSHSPSVIPFGLTDVKMGAMFHNAAFLAQGVPVFDISERFGETDMLVCDCAKGVALAESLGDKDIALMRAHGSVACGPNLQVAVFRAVYTEVSARIQHWSHALAGGGPIAALSPAEGALADVPNQTAGLRAWDLWRSEIREQTGW